MPSSPTSKRMCNPCGIPDAKFFKDGRKGSGEPQRDEPLEGLKKTRQVDNCDDFNQLVLGRKTRRREPSPHARTVALLTFVMGGVFWLSIFMVVAMGIDLGGLVAMLTFFGVHWCAIFSRTLSCGQSRLGLLGLGCFYGTMPFFILLINTMS